MYHSYAQNAIANQRLLVPILKRLVAKQIKNGKVKFMVKWSDYCTSQNTWEPSSPNPNPDPVRVEEATECIDLVFEKGMKVPFQYWESLHMRHGVVCFLFPGLLQHLQDRGVWAQWSVTSRYWFGTLSRTYDNSDWAQMPRNSAINLSPWQVTTMVLQHFQDLWYSWICPCCLPEKVWIRRQFLNDDCKKWTNGYFRSNQMKQNTWPLLLCLVFKSFNSKRADWNPYLHCN